MRGLHPIPPLAGLACLLVFAQAALAGVTIDVVFQDPWDPGDPQGPGCAFTGYYRASVSTGYCMDVVMRSTSELVDLSVSIQYEGDNGLKIASMYEWKGVFVYIDKCGPTTLCRPASGLDDHGEIIQSFDCVSEASASQSAACVSAAAADPLTLSPGTYRIGTVVWDTSAITPGPTWIAAHIDQLVDGFSAVINGNVVDVSGEVVLNSANLAAAAPVPSISAWGYASLFSGLLGIGLVFAARRSRPPKR